MIDSSRFGVEIDIGGISLSTSNTKKRNNYKIHKRKNSFNLRLSSISQELVGKDKLLTSMNEFFF